MTPAEIEENTCTCGAGHGSLEGHTEWCDHISRESLIDLVGELVRDVFYMLDDTEDAGGETLAVPRDGFNKVCAHFDRIEAMPFTEPGCLLGAGAMLQAAMKATFDVTQKEGE